MPNGGGSSSKSGNQSALGWLPSMELRVPPPSLFAPNRPIDIVLTWTVQGSDPEAYKNEVLVVNTMFRIYKIQTSSSIGNVAQYTLMKHGEDFATASTIRNPCKYSQGFYENNELYRRYDFVWRDLEIVRQGLYYLEFETTTPPLDSNEPGQVLGSMPSKAFRVVDDASWRLCLHEQKLLDILDGNNEELRGRNILE